MKKLAIFSANYNAPGEVDAFRLALFRSICAKGIDTLFIQATDFFSDVTSERRDVSSHPAVIGKLESYKPDAVLFLNGAGRTAQVQEAILKLGVPSLTWYWDHPAIHAPELVQPQKNHQSASVNLTYIRYFKNQGIENVPFIPFPCFPNATEPEISESAWSRRQIPLIFMGTLWDPARISDVISLIEGRIGAKHDREQFIRVLEKDVYLKNIGLALPANEVMPVLEPLRKFWHSEIYYLCEVNNFFSGRDRLGAIRNLLDLGLMTWGPENCWNRLIEGTLPELQRCYQNRNVSEPAELEGLLADAKVGFNIFHRQNQGGGTNFRFNEYAMAGTPIISNANEECERVFPHGEAALYYRNTQEMRDAVLEVQKNPALAVKLSKNARAICKAEYSIDKVVAQLLEGLALPATEAVGGFTTFKSSDVPKGQDVSLGLKNASHTTSFLIKRMYRWVAEKGILVTVLHIGAFSLLRGSNLLMRIETRLLERKARRRLDAPVNAPTASEPV